MKKISLKFMGKAMFMSALLFFILSGASSQTVFKSINTENIAEPNKMTIQTLQVNSEKILLNVRMQNPQESIFTFFVIDQDDFELFAQDYNAKEFNLPLTLKRSEVIDSYKIGVRSKNKNLTQSYIITPTERYIADVIVKKQ